MGTARRSPRQLMSAMTDAWERASDCESSEPH